MGQEDIASRIAWWSLLESELAAAWELVSKRVCLKGTGRKIKIPLLYNLLRLTAGPIMRNLNTRWNGVDNIPRHQPSIFAANHLSHVDPLFIITGSRRKIFYLTKDDHFKRKHTAWFMKATGQIETARTNGGYDALSAAVDILDSGHCLGIFPEGTRSKNTEPPFLLRGKTGVARIAAASPNAPVVPIAHIGTREFMKPKVNKIPRPWRKVIFNYGVGITWLEWLGDSQGGNCSSHSIEEMNKLEDHLLRSEISDLYRKFTDQLMQTIKELGAP